MADKKKKQYTNEGMDKSYRHLYSFVKPLFMLLFPFRKIHAENIPEGKVLICPNHFSDLDPLMVCFSVPKKTPIRVMAKQELMKVPILGWLLRRAGIFGVNRGNSDVGAHQDRYEAPKERPQAPPVPGRHPGQARGRERRQDRRHHAGRPDGDAHPALLLPEAEVPLPAHLHRLRHPLHDRGAGGAEGAVQ